MQFSKFTIWLLAIRPKTLWAAVAPVMIGTAMAYSDGREHWPSAIACLLGALAIQIGTNLANDYFDFKKGTDGNRRIGPTRVTQAGLVSPSEMKIALTIVFGIAILICLYLITRGGLALAVIGILSVLCAIFYTAGKYAIGYMGLGELFVLIFFGPVAVGGTYYVQTLEINPLPIIAGLAPGLLSVGILVVNNLRDIDSDRASGKKTLAVRLGRRFAMAEYFFSILGACVVPVVLYILTGDYPFSLSANLISFFAFPAIKTVFTETGPSLNHALTYTAKLLTAYSILFSIGWLL